MEGSKTITTTITVKDTLDRMKDHSYYLGEAAKSNPQIIELAAKIQASNDEDPVLKDFIKDSVSIIANLMSRTMGETGYTNNGTSIVFTTKATANTPDINAQLQDYVTNYMSVYVLENWLNLIKADESIRFSSIRKRLEDEIVILAARRSKPIRS